MFFTVVIIGCPSTTLDTSNRKLQKRLLSLLAFRWLRLHFNRCSLRLPYILKALFGRSSEEGVWQRQVYWRHIRVAFRKYTYYLKSLSKSSVRQSSEPAPPLTIGIEYSFDQEAERRRQTFLSVRNCLVREVKGAILVWRLEGQVYRRPHQKDIREMEPCKVIDREL